MKTVKSEKGQSLVEMAISFVVILVLLVGTVEFGMAFFQYIQLRDAAQEGALYGSVYPADPSGIETRTRGASGTPIDLTVSSGANAVTVSVEYIGGLMCEGNGNAVKVTVKYNHTIFMPFIGRIIGKTILPLSASVTDTILSPAC